MRPSAAFLVLLFAVPCLARPAFVTSYVAGGPHHPVGGQSIVNMFPAGYAYQTILDDGSVAQVIYVTGPDSELVEKSLHLLREAAPAAVVPSSEPSQVSASTPESTGESEVTEAPRAVPDENLVPTTAPAAPAPPTASFFGLPGTFTSYFTNPFNNLMTLLGLPTLNFDRSVAAQASNITPLRAPLSNRIRTSTEASDEKTPTPPNPVEVTVSSALEVISTVSDAAPPATQDAAVQLNNAANEPEQSESEQPKVNANTESVNEATERTEQLVSDTTATAEIRESITEGVSEEANTSAVNESSTAAADVAEPTPGSDGTAEDATTVQSESA